MARGFGAVDSRGAISADLHVDPENSGHPSPRSETYWVCMMLLQDLFPLECDRNGLLTRARSVS